MMTDSAGIRRRFDVDSRRSLFSAFRAPNARLVVGSRMVRGRRCRVALALLACALAQAGDNFALAQAPRGKPADAPIATFPMTTIEEHPDLLAVPVMVSGTECAFVVDTGSTETAVDDRLRHLLRRGVGTSTYNDPFGRAVVKSFRAPRMSIGPMRLRGVRTVDCLDLTRLRKGRFDGVLGMDALRGCVLRLDFESRSISFLKSLPLEPGQPLDLLRDRTMPTILASIGADAPREFVFDTGCDVEVAVARRYFDDLLARQVLVSAGRGPGESLRGGFAFRYGTLTAPLRVADNAHSAVVAYEIPGPHESMNLLGNEFMSRYVVTFDFLNDRVYLKRARSWGALHPRVRLLGVRLRHENGQFVVDSVTEERRGSSPQIQVNDVLQTIDGERATGLSAVELVHRLSIHPGSAHLVFQNPGTGKRWWLRLPAMPRDVPAKDTREPNGADAPRQPEEARAIR